MKDWDSDPQEGDDKWLRLEGAGVGLAVLATYFFGALLVACLLFGD